MPGEAASAVSGRASDELLSDVLDALAHVWRAIGWVPVACHASGWVANPFVGGSYSFPLTHAGADIADALSAPLTSTEGDGEQPTPRVLFCGEATSRSHFGTVHGALFSGSREAERLLDAFGREP